MEFGYIGGLSWREAKENTLPEKMLFLTKLDPNLLLYSNMDNSTKPLGIVHV